ncbi:hypothetical protein FO519_005378, partial [Halicephalobus sp. NKZ332]
MIMATQAVEQTLMSKKQNEELKKLKEKIKPDSDCLDDVNRWRSTRRRRSVGKQLDDLSLDPEGNSNPNKKGNPNLGQKRNPNIGPKGHPDLDQARDSKFDQKRYANFDPERNPNLDPKGNPSSRPLRVDPPFIPMTPRKKDTQEQIIVVSPKQRNEDSGLENSTPEVSPPGEKSRTHWRTQSASSGSDKAVPTSSSETMTQQRFISSKRSFAPSPPSVPSPPLEESPVAQSGSDLSFHQAQIQTEKNASASFFCKKDHSEAALCKAVVAQGALEEVSGTFKAVPNKKHGKFSSVRIEIEATRENHAKVAAVKTIPSKEIQRASAHFKPMCEVIDE